MINKEHNAKYIAERDEYIKRKFRFALDNVNYNPRGMSNRKKLIMAIHYILTPMTLEMVGEIYGHSKPTVNKMMNYCIPRMNEKLATIVFEKMFWNMKEREELFDRSSFDKKLAAAANRLKRMSDTKFNKLKPDEINDIIWNSKVVRAKVKPKKATNK